MDRHDETVSSDDLGDELPLPLWVKVFATVLLGPVLLARPPDFSGWPLRIFVPALFGTMLYAIGLYRLIMVMV